MKYKWHHPLVIRPLISAELFRWLTYSGSLTARLQVEFRSPVRVNRLSESFVRCPADYAHILHMRAGSRIWRREVDLFCGNDRVVHAITLIPNQTLEDWARPLRYIRQRPLGHFLFSIKGIIRSELRISYQNEQWCRYSLFGNQRNNLLVEEQFLHPYFSTQGKI